MTGQQNTPSLTVEQIAKKLRATVARAEGTGRTMVLVQRSELDLVVSTALAVHPMIGKLDRMQARLTRIEKQTLNSNFGRPSYGA